MDLFTWLADIIDTTYIIFLILFLTAVLILPLILLHLSGLLDFGFKIMVKVTIPTKTLNDGNKMPFLGLGTWPGMTAEESAKVDSQTTEPKVHDNFDGIIDRGEVKKIKEALSYALEIGYRHIDTAAVYRVESAIGDEMEKAIKNKLVKREDLYIVTKLWNDKHKPEDVEPTLRESLSKLKTDYVDLYLVHWPFAFDASGNVELIDFVETWKAMEQVKAKGLAKSIGVSNFNTEQLQRLLANCTIVPAVNQIEVNLNLQQPELVDFCHKAGIVVTAYTPFGSILGTRDTHNYLGTGAKPTKIDDPKLVSIAKKYNKTVTQILLKHLVQQGMIAIPKSSKLPRILENASIFDFELSASEMEDLKSFDNGYRTNTPVPFQEHPEYPFQKAILDFEVKKPKELLHTL